MHVEALICTCAGCFKSVGCVRKGTYRFTELHVPLHTRNFRARIDTKTRKREHKNWHCFTRVYAHTFENTCIDVYMAILVQCMCVCLILCACLYVFDEHVLSVSYSPAADQDVTVNPSADPLLKDHMHVFKKPDQYIHTYHRHVFKKPDQYIHTHHRHVFKKPDQYIHTHHTHVFKKPDTYIHNTRMHSKSLINTYKHRSSCSRWLWLAAVAGAIHTCMCTCLHLRANITDACICTALTSCDRS
jgi:hypothetical protein